ncbi:MAG: AraC family transcriptional regulator [Lachnospiraceae bacterium]|jgi:AraC-like DNA-binding protein|nr:AraC family transcriptional regulator [Lachnospiraceae bacterium]
MFASVSVISVTVILLCVSFSVASTSALSKQFYYTNVESLKQVQNTVTEISNITANIGYQIYDDVAIQKLILYGETDAFTVANALSQIGNYRRAFPFIISIYVLNPENEFLCVSNGNEFFKDSGIYRGRDEIANFGDTQAMEILENCHVYSQYAPIPRILKNDLTSLALYSYVKYDLLAGGAGVIMINISGEWLEQIVQNEVLSRDQYATLIFSDELGVVFSNPRTYADGIGYLGLERLRGILGDTADGYSVADIDRTKSLVAYTKPDKNGWRYVRIIPYYVLTKDTLRLRNTVVILAILVLAFAVTGFVIGSLPLLRPLDEMKLLIDKSRILLNENYYYPRVSNINRLLMMGKAQEAREEYTQLMDDSYNYIKDNEWSIITKLAATLNQSVAKVAGKQKQGRELGIPPIKKSADGGMGDIGEIDLEFRRFFDRMEEFFSTKPMEKKGDLVNTIDAIICREYPDPSLCAAKIAQEVHMSGPWANKQYTDLKGESIPDRITAIRMLRAGELLQSTDSPVKDIAAAVGIPNTTYFYRLFKSYHGQTPSAYRASHKAGQ